jgi:hypothetical protein
VTISNICRFGALFAFCSISACEKRGTIIEFSPDLPPPPFIGGGTCDYGPTKTEKKLYDRLSESSRITLQTKPGESSDGSHAFKLQGHKGEFVSWWGIVRDIKRNPNGSGGTLLIENKYFDGYSDCYLFESISNNGRGDFETELTDLPGDLVPLVLVRVYGVITREQDNRAVVKADYVRVWHWGQFAFFSYGEDHGNPEWKKRVKLPADENPYILFGSKSYYLDHLGPTAEQWEMLRKYYRRQTIIEVRDSLRFP